MWGLLRKNAFFIAFFTVFTFVLFSDKDRESPYNRIIIGDAKAYYAYLPAVFMYQDSDFEFTKQIEKKYYPSDGSLTKNFLNELPNGKKVNKTFPGLAVLYAPFFFLAWLFSAIFGFETDGYSSPFQYAVALSHVFYFTLALRILWSILKSFQVKFSTSVFSFLILTLGTNCWYYLVYDFSVSHIHAFFLVSLTLWCFLKWLRSRELKFLGFGMVLLTLIAILRPTTVLIILFLPFVLFLSSEKLSWSIKLLFTKIKRLLPFAFLSLGILMIPLFLWKWQTGLWFVYSYSNERFDFSKPHFIDFLFSFKKGWLLWSPSILVAFALLFFIASRNNFKTVLALILPYSLIAFVFSCWWIWTFGMGFGQRPMIEFLPFLLVGILLLLKQYKHNFILVFGFVPLLFLSLLQGFQFGNYIHLGGNTTKEQYVRRFFQFKQDASTFSVSKIYQLVLRKAIYDTRVNKNQTYSKALKFPLMNTKNQLLKITTSISSTDKKPNLQLVANTISGSFYRSFSLTEQVSSDFSNLEFGTAITNLNPNDILLVYIWNGDSYSTAKIKKISIELFEKR